MPTFKTIFISIIASMLAYCIWILINDWQSVLETMARLGSYNFIIVCVASLLNYGLRYWRWHGFLSHMGHTKIPHTRHALYYLAGFGFTTTPGKAGEAIRSRYLKPYGIPYTHSLAALLAERLSDLSVIYLLSIGAAIFIPGFTGYGLILTAFIPLLYLVFLAPQTTLWGEALLSKLSNKTLKNNGQKLLSLMTTTRTLLGAKPLLLGLFIGILAWGAESIAFGWMVHQLGYEGISLVLLAGIYALSTLVGALSFMPGGLGGTELVMKICLTSLAISSADAVSITLLCRIATLWLAVVIGLAALVYIESRSKEKTSKTQPQEAYTR